MKRSDKDIAKVIEEKYVTSTSLYDGKYTKTTQFILPAVGINLKNQLVFRFFINAYVGDKGHENAYERPIFVLFGTEDVKNPYWLKTYNALTESKNYTTDYDCGIQDNKHLVMMIFQVPKQFVDDYYNFKKGKYSKFSEEFKSKFPQYIKEGTGPEKESIIWQVINKADSLKREVEREFMMPEGSMNDAEEIWDIPRRNREYYRYED